VRFEERRLNAAALPEGCAVVAVQACGGATDAAIGQAIEARGAVAAMPCCYGGTAARSPSVMKRKLGVALSTDIHRTYRLVEAGYDVDWKCVPSAITPMNRVLVGTLLPEGRSRLT